MHEYKDFVWGREDEYNINLYQFQQKEIRINAGRGMGKGTGTGTFERKLVFLGHYNTISGVLFRVLEMDLEATEVKDFTKALREFKAFSETMCKGLVLPIEEKRIAEQVEEEV